MNGIMLPTTSLPCLPGMVIPFDSLALPAVAVFGLLGAAAAVAFAMGRERWLRPAVALTALVLSSGLLGFFRGVIHGCHSIRAEGPEWTPFMAGVSQGLNTVMISLLIAVVLTVVLLVGFLRQGRGSQR